MGNTKYEKLQIDGVDYKTTFTDKWRNRKNWETPDPKLVEAYLPGTIVNVNVKEGQKIRENDLLLVLQAMKMDNKITSPVDGKVKAIHVKKGDQIPKGTVMIELE
ncbi:MAG: acetyl-CoA carboxylase biotin carboxyl carrier protein subunit [Culturomica sp.]|jgi:biotin carboxyl carrier protein|nr:acetyl-CoA carboxylase biotin carboxyl carrier protein subunit [Culturomica sp.]